MAGYESLAELTLRPWPVTKKEELSPQDLLLSIEQLGNERGHLRDVTEQSLQEDIAAGKESPGEAAEDVEQTKKKEKAAPSRDARLQEVLKMQYEMSQHMEWAKFAANNTVDLISLILSSDPNKRSLANFSHTIQAQGLNQGLPLGSFGLSKEDHAQHQRSPQEREILHEYAQRQELVSKGSRMEALDRATDDILKAARKLEKEVRRETRYWQEIVSISDEGWPIQRVRQNMRNVPFAVRYGYAEASNHFKARGLAPLRMDRDGSIMLDPALALKPKTLRVRISEAGRITGTSRLPMDGGTSTAAIENTIQRARDSLFEEELYHEMTLESRQLLAYGVDYRDGIIHVHMSGASNPQKSTKLLIDCVQHDDLSGANQDLTNNWLAQHMAEGLRLLLVHEHSMRLYRRTQLPSALTSQKREKPSPPLLRILLAVLYHLEGADALYNYLDTVAETLKSAGLPVELEMTREVSWARLAESLQASSKALPVADQLLDIFSRPFEGRATLTLIPSTGTPLENLIISTRTVIGQPTFGTEHRLTLPLSLAEDLDLQQQHKFSSVEETTSYLDWIFTLHIAHRQLRTQFSARAVTKSDEARITIRSKDNQKASTAHWHVVVDMQDGRLHVIATAAIPEETIEDDKQSYTWTGQGAELSLLEKVKSWIQ